MPLMKLACTALERVPLTRMKIIEYLMKKFHQDLVFCRAPGDSDLTIGVLGMFFIYYASNFLFYYLSDCRCLILPKAHWLFLPFVKVVQYDVLSINFKIISFSSAFGR